MHPLVNCGGSSGRWVLLTVACGYLLRSAVRARLREKERESCWVSGSQWVGPARQATPHRVHPPLSAQACLSRSSAEVFITPSHGTQRTIIWLEKKKNAAGHFAIKFKTDQILHLRTHVCNNDTEKYRKCIVTLIKYLLHLIFYFSRLCTGSRRFTSLSLVILSSGISSGEPRTGPVLLEETATAPPGVKISTFSFSVSLCLIKARSSQKGMKIWELVSKHTPQSTEEKWSGLHY